MRLGRTVGKNHYFIAVRFVSIGNARRNLHEAVIVLSKENFLELSFGQWSRTSSRVSLPG
jgi:hypothetical protein